MGRKAVEWGFYVEERVFFLRKKRGKNNDKSTYDR